MFIAIVVDPAVVVMTDDDDEVEVEVGDDDDDELVKPSCNCCWRADGI